jgi:hypothetical protein
MRRYFAAILLCTLLIAPLSFSLNTKADDPIIDSIEKVLTDESYYTEESVAVKDFIDVHTDVAINEEETKEYKVKVLFVTYEQTRDDFFQFQKGGIYYYNLDEEKLLDTSSVIMNDELKNFAQDHKEDVKKHLTAGSQFLFILLVFLSILIIPFFVMVFHRLGTSDNTSL